MDLELAAPLSILMGQYDFELKEPEQNVSIIMPSYNEEEFIEKACASIYNQSIIKKYPGKFEFILVDSHSTDNSVKLAQQYVDKIIFAGRGKLTARNIATSKATGDIIVSVDADCIYPDGWLNTLIKPLGSVEKKQKIIATCGSSIDLYSFNMLIDYYFNEFNKYRMMGRNSAYFKDIFYMSGGLNDNINQTNPTELIAEEEIGFGRRLFELGKVKYIRNAGCIHLGANKVFCRVNKLFGVNIGNQCEIYKMGTDRY